MDTTTLETARIRRVIIEARLSINFAKDLSDEEITRCFINCVSPTRLVLWAKALRDAGELTLETDQWK